MILSDAVAKIRALTNTDAVSYTDANLLIDINMWYQRAITIVLESHDDFDFDDARRSDYPVFSRALVAGQRDYAIPVTDKVLKIKRVDISYDGTTYYRASAIDTGGSSVPQGNNTQTDSNYNTNAPTYDVKYNSIWVYPLPTASQVAAGATIRVEVSRQITELTSSELTAGTAVFGFDDPYHPYIVYGCAYEFAMSRQLPQANQLLNMVMDIEIRMRKHYGTKNEDRVLYLQPVLQDFS